jgi:uncharacterized protein YqgC (DUF456 family)
MITTILLWALVVVLVLVGLAGLVLPGLPGAPLMFGGLLMAAWIEDFAFVGPWTLVALGFMALLTFAVDFAAGALGAKKFGASKYAVFGAFAGAIVGIFFGLPGIVLGPFCGAVAGELMTNKSFEEATAAGVGTTIGLLVGVAAKMTLAFSMLGVFLLVRLWGGFG